MKSRVAVVSVAVVLLVVACGDAGQLATPTSTPTPTPVATPTPTPTPEPAGNIAFSKSDRDTDTGAFGNGEIYVMNADGSNQTNLTNNPAGYGTFAWSPVP